MTAQPQHTEGRPFTVPALAERWECSEGLIRKMIASGELFSFRIGVLIRIPLSEVERVECQSRTASNDSGEDMPSSGTTAELGDAAGSTPRIGRARKPRPGSSGSTGIVHHGPWGG